MKATWNNLDKKMQFYKLCSTGCTTTLTRRDLIPSGKRKEVMNYFEITQSKNADKSSNSPFPNMFIYLPFIG